MERYPRNRRVREIARQSLNYIGNPAQQQYNNAIYVNGTVSFLYVPLRGGLPCTCRQNALQIFDSSGNLPDFLIKSLMEDVSMRGAYDKDIPSTPLRTKYGHEIPVSRFSADTFELPESTVFNESEDKDLLTELIESDTKDAINTDINMEGLSSNAPDILGFPVRGKVGCGVCFGTGFVGGFSLFQGWRVVIPAYSLISNKLNSGKIRHSTLDDPHLPQDIFLTDTAPVKLNMAKDTAITYGVQFPAHPFKEFFCGVYNDTRRLHESQYLLNDLIFGKAFDLKLLAKNELEFTHIVFQGIFSDLLCDFPKLDRHPSASILDNLIGSEIILPPTVIRLERGSVVADSTRSRKWALNAVSEFSDAERTIHGWNTTGRLVQDYEPLAILPHPTTQYVPHSGFEQAYKFRGGINF